MRFSLLKEKTEKIQSLNNSHKLKKNQNFKVAILSLLLLASCSVEPEPIDFGREQCNHCMMNIVDKAHAAQYVTKKGKQYKFDAVECLINYLSNKDEKEIEQILVADYNNPRKMIEAKNAAYIISENINSPMGANLSAVTNVNDAEKLVEEHGGDVYKWDEIKAKIAGSE